MTAPTGPEIRVETARNGSPTLTVDGRYVHSRHDPEREAARAVAAAVRRSPPAIVMFGIGLGYHAACLLERTSLTRLIVFEPSREIVAIARTRGRLREAEQTGRLTLVHDTSTLHRMLPSRAAEGFETFDISRGTHRADAFDAAREVTETFSRRLEINRHTLHRFGRIWVRNLCRNLERISASRGVSELAARFVGLPVLVLAAGPTLDQALPLLRDLARRFVVVAVDTAVAPAVDAGVRPDFAVVVDPQYWNARHLDRVAPSTTLLVSEASAHPRVFRSFTEPAFLCSSVFPLGRAFEEVLGQFGQLGAGGSVSTTAWDLARLLGASETVVAGLDLGFPGGRTHCRSSFFEHLAVIRGTRIESAESVVFRYVWSAEPRAISANDGTTLLSDRRMEIYRDWFVQQLRLPGVPRTSSVTSGGASIPGLACIPTADALALPVCRDEIDARIAAIGTASGRSGERQRSLMRETEALARSLSELARIATAAAAEVGSIRVQHLAGRPVDFTTLVPLDRRLGEHAAGAIASFLIQDAIGRIRAGYGSASIGEQIEASMTMYEGLAEGADYHAAELSAAVARLC